MTRSDIGVIGLAVMGSNLALNFADHGFKVSGFNRDSELTNEFVESERFRQAPGHTNFTPTHSLPEFVDSLAKPVKS